MNILLFLLFCDVIQYVYGAACVKEYFSQPVIYDRAMNIDFYYTGINVASVTRCAEFCSERQFCRTAVYNTFANTCAISYEYTLNCRYNKLRYDHYDAVNASSNLIQIACVTKCSMADTMQNVSKRRRPLPDSSTKPQPLRKVQLITGEPNDGKGENIKKKIYEDAEKKEDDEFITKVKINTRETAELHDEDKGAAPSQVCYRTIPHRYLMGGAFERHDGTTFNECRCLCAATLMGSHLHKCRSLHWYKTGTCILNKGNHRGRFDLIKDSQSTYQYVDCNPDVMLEVAAKVCIPKDETQSIAEIDKNKKQEAINQKSTEKTTETSQNPETSKESSKIKPARRDIITTTTEEIPSTETTQSHEITEKSNEKEEEEKPFFGTRTLPKEATASPETSSELYSSTPSEEEEGGSCFERIPGYMMISVAGGLESDVSLEECICHCTNSKASGRYQFECASATYYHDERDCILNLADRTTKTDLFEKQFKDINVTYIGFRCDREKSLSSFSELILENRCKITKESSIVTTTPVATSTYRNSIRRRAEGVNGDACFSEMTDFVLEGTSLAVETALTPQQCKCMCTEGESRYGESCQSFQYYYDSSTCLINKHNRFSNPENFNFVPSAQRRSYFENKCITGVERKLEYLKEKCGNGNQITTNEIEENNKSEEKKEKSDETEIKQSKEKENVSNEKEDEKKEEKGREKASTEKPIYEIEEKTESTPQLTEKPTTTTTTEATTTTAAVTETTKTTRKRIMINHLIPEAEGLEDKDFENEFKDQIEAELDNIPFEQPHHVGESGRTHNTLLDDSQNQIQRKTHGVKTIKFDAKEDKPEKTRIEIPSTKVLSTTSTTTEEPTTQPTTTTVRTTTTTRRTTTTAGYPSVGKCTYSALYQTAFLGRKMLKTVHVKNAADCFAACYALRCRSANLIQQGELNSCELYRDSLIDYRRPDMIGYDGSTVYFDGIRCEEV